MSTRIPSLLEPYLSLPPEASLILLTNVLGASSNWLLLRFIYSSLLSSSFSPSIQPTEAESEDKETKVVLVSFLRNLAFWKEGARKIGLDLDKLAAKNRFHFLDGLSGLFVPNAKSSSRVGETVLISLALTDLSSTIQATIKGLEGNGSSIVLLLDGLDLLLAAGGDQVDAVAMGQFLTDLREMTRSTILTLSADYPLVAAQQTPLEKNHAAFLLGVAHQADLTIGLRLLDSGTARDVSGVLRITVGDQGGNKGEGWEDQESLYFVGGDGGVKVFERGQ